MQSRRKATDKKPRTTRTKESETRGPWILHRLASFETLFLLFALLAAFALRPSARVTESLPPALAAAAAFVLLITPGVALGGLLAGKAGLALRAALAVPLGITAFGLPALAALALNTSFAAYVAVGRWVVVVSLVVLLCLALWRAVAGRTPEQTLERTPERGAAPGRWDLLLWTPFAGLAGVLAAVSAVMVHEPNTDLWTYLRFIEEFSGSAALNGSVEGFSRTTLGGWFLVQAALSGVSGVEPVPLTLDYLTPFLVVAAVLAFYGTARVLFEKNSAALFAGCLYALFLLVSLDGTIFSTGGEFVGRITEDKFAARFLFLPPALAAAVLFARERRLGYLALFSLLCAGVLSVHPVGLVVIGIPVAGFGLVHLALNLRRFRAWLVVFGLWAAGLAVVAPLGGYLLATDSKFLSRLNDTPPALVDFRVRVWEYEHRLLALGDGSYIMHPALLLEPLVLAGYAVGVPFLVWKSWRSVTARLLLGTLILTPALIYIPPVSSFIGEIIGPWTLWRLAWPIPLAAALTVAWVAWEVLDYARRRLLESRMAGAADPVRFAAGLLPLAAVVVLAAAALPAVSTAVRSVETPDEVAWDATSCSDPVFPFLEDIGASGGIMAQDGENSCIAAYSDDLRVLSYRTGDLNAQASLSRRDIDGSQGGGVVENFFGSSSITRPIVQALEGHNVAYALLPVNSPLNPALGGLPGVTTLDNPGNRYQLYKVDREELYVTPTVQANTYLENGDAARAEAAYQQALSGAGSPEEEVGTLTGLAAAYSELGRPAQAAATYQSALDLAPTNLQPPLFSLAADAYTAAGDFTAAQSTLGEAAERFPENAALRQRLASALLFEEPAEAVAEQEAVVETYPEVASYHARLGSVISLAAQANASAANADQEASDAQRQAERQAEEQYEKARELEPLSAELEAEIATYHSSAGDFEAAASSYERSVELEPDNAYYRLKLGEVYSTLATRSGGEESSSGSSSDGSGDGSNEDSEGYYGKAERELRRSVELELLPWQEAGLRAEGWVALGDLYGSRGREGEAREAYEAALEADPDSLLARQRVESLR